MQSDRSLVKFSKQIFAEQDFGPFRVSPVGVVVVGEPTFEEWQSLGDGLQRLGHALKWAIGDWLLAGEHRYGEKYTAAVEATGWENQTLRNLKWVASKFELSRRRDNLPWSTHEAVAALPPDVADTILARADAEHLSRAAVRELVRAASAPPVTTDNDDDEHDTDLETVPEPTPTDKGDASPVRSNPTRHSAPAPAPALRLPSDVQEAVDLIDKHVEYLGDLEALNRKLLNHERDPTTGDVVSLMSNLGLPASPDYGEGIIKTTYQCNLFADLRTKYVKLRADLLKSKGVRA